MITAIETATMMHLYSALPSPTAAQPAQEFSEHRFVFPLWNRGQVVLPSDTPRGNTTFVAEAGFQSASAVQATNPAAANYDQGPADLAVAQLLRMEEWDADWDGNGAAKPLGFSLKDARAFIRALSPESVIPKATLHADGHTILFVNGPEIYAELEFLEDHRIGFYVR